MVQLLPLRIPLWLAGTHSGGERHGLMYLPMIQGDAVDWPSIRLLVLPANPRTWLQVSQVLAMAWGWARKHSPTGFCKSL